MKVIELLNKIANGEDVPKKIKFRNDIFRYTGCSYYCDAMCTTLFNIYNFSILNEKVEIIEENKKIEPIKKVLCDSDLIDRNHFVTEYLVELKYKINELIFKVNELEDKDV